MERDATRKPSVRRKKPTEKIKDHKYSPTWYSWRAMIRRCYDPKNDCYQDYGARGITVCKRWRTSFLLFLRDMGDRPDGMTLDRIRCSQNYKPGNCRWATITTQNRNRRSNVFLEYQGEIKTVAEWCDLLNLSRNMVYKRIQRGMPSDQIISTSPRNFDVTQQS